MLKQYLMEYAGMSEDEAEAEIKKAKLDWIVILVVLGIGFNAAATAANWIK